MAKSAVVETDDILAQARKEFERCREAWSDNQDAAREDLQFARLGGDYQWVGTTAETRRKEGRPAETFNKMPAFIRQVVNDSRQNKPAIKVHPQEGGDKQTAEIINGLIRNIETTSDADVAYDTAIEHAVGQGFGFWRINTRYACDDTFEQDIVIERVANPLTVYGDSRSTAADSSDWNDAFIVSTMSKDEFEREYPDAERTNWEHDFRDCPDWIDGDDVMVAEYWSRRKVAKQIVALADGEVIDVEKLPELGPVQTVGQPREVESYEVTQRIMSGAEELKKVKWPGKFIPIVPVYGDEVIDDKGKRHFRSLIRDAKGAQRSFNYMRNVGIEALGLAPRVPFIGRKGAFASDPNWDTANSVSHSYLEYDGDAPPQRQPLPQHYTAAAQEALIANDDMKAIIGIYDASLGQRSNETSGRAIMARQREGDVSTFHFIDNLQRAIRHGGRILLDLIPKVYSTARIIRTLGEDMTARMAQIAPTGQPVTQQVDQAGNVLGAIYDITAGKYDLTVKAGPSYTSMREENRVMMTEMATQGGPVVGSVLIPKIAKMMDLPEADTIAAELEAKLNPQPQQGVPPEISEQLQQGMQLIQQLQAENQELKAGRAEKQIELQIKARDSETKAKEVQIKAFEAETARIQAQLVPTAGYPGSA